MLPTTPHTHQRISFHITRGLVEQLEKQIGTSSERAAQAHLRQVCGDGDDDVVDFAVLVQVPTASKADQLRSEAESFAREDPHVPIKELPATWWHTTSFASLAPLCVPLANFVNFCNSLSGYVPQLRPDPNPPCDFYDGDKPVIPSTKSNQKKLKLIDQTNLLLSTGFKQKGPCDKKQKEKQKAPCFRNAPLSMFTGTPNKARRVMHRIMIANGYHYELLEQKPPSEFELMMYPPTNTISTVRTGLESLSAAVQLKDCVHLTNKEKQNRVQARHDITQNNPTATPQPKIITTGLQEQQRPANGQKRQQRQRRAKGQKRQRPDLPAQVLLIFL